MRRGLAVAALVLVAGAAVYWFLIRDETVAPQVHVPELTATIGSGEEAVGVSSSGQIVPFIQVPEDQQLPRLPLEEVPKSGHLAGPVLEKMRFIHTVIDEMTTDPVKLAAAGGEVT